MNEGAIYNQISDKTKQAIDDQISHLENCAENFYPEEKERFTNLRDGAKTVLNILLSDKICATGTTAWLMNLDYDQLVFAKEKASELIQRKNDEVKVKLWGVLSDFKPNKWFKECSEAEQYLKDNISEYLDCMKGKRNKFKIDYTMVLPSEVEEYLNP
jgi:hypothetical protein